MTKDLCQIFGGWKWRVFFTFLSFIFGTAVTYFFMSYSLVIGPEHLGQTATEFKVTYTDFLSISLTILIVLLSILALALGLLAFFGYSRFEKTLGDAVESKVNKIKTDIETKGTEVNETLGKDLSVSLDYLVSRQTKETDLDQEQDEDR